jgi:sirohydrochlorin cobaltochelatase
MRALIVIAHGSRQEAANAEFGELVMRLRTALSGVYDRVAMAFLDLTAPRLDEAAESLIADGAVHIDVYPFFLNMGKHAAQDIPKMAADVADSHPDCVVRVLDYLGKACALMKLCEEHILEQQDSGS